MKVRWFNRTKLESEVKKRIYKTNLVLDIGCGIQPQKHFKPAVHICLDPHKEYLEYLRNRSSASNINRAYIHSDWSKGLSLLTNKSIDTVFIQDVIEHIPKKTAKNLISKTERIVKNQIVIFTPLGFTKQEHKDKKDAWGLSGGKWQNHKSGWEPKDFDSSWDIYACKDYHKENNMGEKVEKPFGAFYAIKNISQPTYSKSQLFQRESHKVLDQLYTAIYKLRNIFHE